MAASPKRTVKVFISMFMAIEFSLGKMGCSDAGSGGNPLSNLGPDAVLFMKFLTT
jgi:hypothetical protein